MNCNNTEGLNAILNAITKPQEDGMQAVPERQVGAFKNMYQEHLDSRQERELPEDMNPKKAAQWLRDKYKLARHPRKWKKGRTIISGRRNNDRRPNATGILYLSGMDMDQHTADKLHRLVKIQHAHRAPIILSTYQVHPALVTFKRVREVRIIQFLKP